MSYAKGTTHYGLPQTVGTDKRDWFDTNRAFAEIDEALYGAVQESASTAIALTALTTRVGTAESNITAIQSSQSTDEANISALQTLTSQHTTQIADVKADALDMICAVDEGTAQVATVAVAEGKYFRYNDVLYMATTDIAVGDTIVPNTNCRATNVATELESVANSGYDRVVVINGTEHTTFATAYEFDSDGYLNNVGGQFLLYGSNSDGTSKYITSTTELVYIKKGMKIAFTQAPIYAGYFRFI